MTTRPAIVRTVFNEIADSLSGVLPLGDLLQSASTLVELELPKEEGPNVDLRSGGLPFSCWSVDAAMARNAGWKVCGYEREIVGALYEDDRDLITTDLEINEFFKGLAA
tara:strand:+ start:309 stop:635 length:327 start_codon:yes stop_codon:yes gene_type:complete